MNRFLSNNKETQSYKLLEDIYTYKSVNVSTCLEEIICL